MEQSNNFNNQGGGKGPKMPRFNMNWLYTIILIALIALFFSGGGDALGGGAAKEATYTEFKQYVDKGYVLSVVANKTENTLKIYINPKYTRDVYKMSAQNVGPNPYVKVQFGSVDEVDRYGNQMVKEKKIRSFSYDNKKDNDFWNLIISLAPLLLFFLFLFIILLLYNLLRFLFFFLLIRHRFLHHLLSLIHLFHFLIYCLFLFLNGLLRFLFPHHRFH